jgi:hypothetical protein
LRQRHIGAASTFAAETPMPSGMFDLINAPPPKSRLATGIALDRMGELWNLPRMLLEDDEGYRLRLLGQMETGSNHPEFSLAGPE